mgnify:CR=1 FL=1
MTRLVPCLLLVLALTGCAGYRVGSLSHPQIHTVQVAALKNSTSDPRVGPMAAATIRQRVVQDGSWELVEEGADVILHAEVTAIRYNRTAANEVASGDKDQRIYRSTSFGTEVDVHYWVERPGQRAPLSKRHTVTGFAEYSEYTDPDVMRQAALRQALADAAVQVVAGATEAW